MFWKMASVLNSSNKALFTLHKKPYFLNPGISLKAQNDQLNIIFPSTFWLKKKRIPLHQKIQNKNFSVINKYHISINFLTRKKTIFSICENVKTKAF